jgi:hypothetical protein
MSSVLVSGENKVFDEIKGYVQKCITNRNEYGGAIELLEKAIVRSLETGCLFWWLKELAFELMLMQICFLLEKRQTLEPLSQVFQQFCTKISDFKESPEKEIIVKIRVALATGKALTIPQIVEQHNQQYPFHTPSPSQTHLIQHLISLVSSQQPNAN